MVVFLKFFSLLNMHTAKAQDGTSTDQLPKTAFAAAQEAIFEYRSGNYEKAADLFETFWKLHSDSLNFQTEYIDFLLKTGKFQKILDLPNISGKKNIQNKEKAEECLKVLKSKNAKQISELIHVAPDSLDVVIAIIEMNVKEGNFAEAEKYVTHAERLTSIENFKKLNDLRIVVKFGLRKYVEGLNLLRASGYTTVFTEYSSVYEDFKRYSNEEQDIPAQIKLRNLGRIYNIVLRNKQFDNMFVPSIYNSFYLTVLEYLVEYGCNIKYEDIISYASRLANIDNSETTIFNHIRAAIIAQQLGLAKSLLNKNETKLSQNRRTYLNSLIQLEVKKEEEKKERERKEQEERERRMAEERERALHRNATNKAGTDFLNYYKVLGANKSFCLEKLKKAHRTAMRKANKIASSKKEAEMKVVNKAFQILSDPEKKKAYDLGIDPDAVPQQSQHHGHHQGHYSDFFQEKDMDEIFKTFFGGGRSGNRRGGSRTQYVFFNQ